MRIAKTTQGSTAVNKLSGAFKPTFIHIMIIATIFFIFYAISVCYSQKKIEYREKQAQQRQIEQEIVEIRQENGGLRNEIGFLKTSEGVEEIAREKLGLIKPKEIAFVVISTPSPSDSNEKKNVENNKEKTIRLKEEIKKESAKKEGWLSRILNKLW